MDSNLNLNEWMEKFRDELPVSSLTPENTKGNIENFVGEVKIPLGLAGPIAIEGKTTSGNYPIPLATTEGALVASVNRGCKALQKVTTTITKDAQTRAILLSTKSAKEAFELKTYILENANKLKEIGEATSNHLEIENIQTFQLDRYLWLRFVAHTDQAMGMNMITIAAEAIGHFIVEQKKSTIFESVSGNMCTDKKPSALTKIMGRGKTVIAEGIVSREDVESILKTTPEKIVQINLLKNMLGSSFAGSYGHNAHHANMVAAIYAATGQDLAHVVDGSLGTTVAELQDDNLRISVTLPALQTGVIGGGTKLPIQKKILALLELSAENKGAKQLAEIAAAGVLAGELSLLAAEAQHHLGKAHQDLNR